MNEATPIYAVRSMTLRPIDEGQRLTVTLARVPINKFMNDPETDIEMSVDVAVGQSCRELSRALARLAYDINVTGHIVQEA